MLAQHQTITQSRFKALQFRAIPRQVSASSQAQAVRLVASVRAIRPGVYLVGNCTIDQWRNSCTCKQARRAKLAGKIAACPHRLALWLAEGVDIDNPDPALYLKAAEIEQPEIVATYAHVTGLHGLHRIERHGEQWVAVPLNDLAAWQLVEAGDITHLQPLYE